MFDLDKWGEILQTLTRNKSRSLLTAFGIFWGVFMLVLLMGSGKGLQRLMASNFEGVAQNSGFVFANRTSKAYKGFKSGREWELQLSDVDRLSRLQDVDVATPLQASWGSQATYREKQSNVTLKGVRPDYAYIEDPHLTHGRFLTEADEKSFRKVCVIGKRVCEELFPGVENPCGKFVRVNGAYYQVVGMSLMSSKVGLMGNAEQSILIPFSTYNRLYNRGTAVGAIAFTARPGATVTRLEPEVERLLRTAHSLAPDDKQALFLFNLETMFQMISSLFSGIETLVWLIGLGTLFSGAIGVSNIMMVTVRERTVEIGIRRAIGARPSHIMGQVMAESILLTLAAGLSGIVVAVLILAGVEAGVAAKGTAASFQVPFGMALGAAATMALLGGLAGIAPSLRALAVKPIEAIRDE